MANPIIDPGEQFRKAKRALLTVAAGTILFGLATVGPTFTPKVLGHDVQLRSWIIALALFLYTIYLWLGFEHEQRRAMAVYNERTYSDDPDERGFEDAMVRLNAPIEAFAQRFEQLTGELELAERTFQFGESAFELSAEQITSATIARMRLWETLEEVRAVDIAGGEQAKEQLMLVLSKLAQGLEGIPDLVAADVKKLIDPAREANAGRKMRADSVIIRLQDIQEQISAAGADLKIANGDVKRLSRRLGARERYMFSYHDTWAPRFLAAAAVLVSSGQVATTLVAKWPVILACQFA